MEQKRLKGRGLEEVAHYFFSSKTHPDQSVALPQEESPAKVFALVSLVEDLPTPFLTANISLELSYRKQKVLVADTSWGMMNIFFALGMEKAFTPIEQFLTGDRWEVMVNGPLGIKLLTFPLDPTRLALLKSIQPGGLFRSLVREEQRSDVLLVNMTYQPQNLLGGPAFQIFSVAQEVLILASSDLKGLKSCYRFMKSLFRQNQRARFGILLYHSVMLGDPKDRFEVLAEAVTKFLGRKLKEYGHLIHDCQLYLSLVHGKPLCRGPERDSNVQVFAEMAKMISGQNSKDIPLLDLIRASERRLLLETLSSPASAAVPASFSASLSREEETFFTLYASGR